MGSHLGVAKEGHAQVESEVEEGVGVLREALDDDVTRGVPDRRVGGLHSEAAVRVRGRGVERVPHVPGGAMARAWREVAMAWVWCGVGTVRCGHGAMWVWCDVGMVWAWFGRVYHLSERTRPRRSGRSHWCRSSCRN
eukprot:scaffold50849_cov56-Phaeocystis_antarctica.AAC.2